VPRSCTVATVLFFLSRAEVTSMELLLRRTLVLME